MALHHITGKDGENEAVRMLEEKGYVILERNWRFKRGEIDIIANANDTIIFIEVKTRSTEKYGYAEYAVGNAKQKLMVATAEEYVYSKQLNNAIRFDVITIIVNNNESKITHFEDAFFPNPADDLF